MKTESDEQIQDLPADIPMGKELSDMSLEELWTLFPIILVPHDDRWREYYNDMAFSIRKILSGFPVDRISHIGNTAIEGIQAKNIVDVMIEIPEKSDIEAIACAMEQSGFVRLSTNTARISLNKGYTKDGFADKVYHIHIRYTGDNDELYFRDYMNDHTEVAKEYESLKLSLGKKYEHNRDAYTEAKTDFVRKWTAEAHREYGEK